MNNTKPRIYIVVENEQPITTSRNVADNFDKELKEKGKIVISGRVSAKYFEERMY